MNSSFSSGNRDCITSLERLASLSTISWKTLKNYRKHSPACSLWNIISPMSVCTRFFLNRQKCTRLCQPLDYRIKYNADYYIDDITVEVPYAKDCFIDLTVPGQFVYIGRGTASPPGGYSLIKG